MCSEGAPECYRSDEFLEQCKLNVQPSVDIWSFGAVCSEAAVWVVLGISGLTEYRSQRKQEICGKNTSQDGSCFHDGDNVLKTVEAMHGRLLNRGEVRPGDHVTKPVVDQMISSMLMEEPDGRQNAIWLWKRSRKISNEAQSKLQEPTKQSTTSDVSVVATSRMSVAYGPPPNFPQYRPNPQVPGQSSSFIQTPTRRSDTWHEQSTRGSGSLHGSPSPPITTRQPLGASPPLESYHDFREQPDVYGTTSGGDATLQTTNQLHYSPPNGLRPRLESNPRHSKIDSVPTVYENFYPEKISLSGEASQGSPPKTPTPPLVTNAIVTETAAKTPPQEIKPEKPRLSYKGAKRTRETGVALPHQSQDLLNDLKNRDHVSSYMNIIGAPLMMCFRCS